MKKTRNYRSLTTRLLLVVVLSSAFFTLLATAIQLYVDFRNDLQKIESNFDFIERSYMEMAAASLYFMDDEQLKIQMKGALNLPDIHSIKIEEPRGTKLFTNFKEKGDSLSQLEKRYPIHYTGPLGYRDQLGTLIVVADLDAVYDRLQERIVLILLTNGAKALLATLTIFWFIHLLVTRHLRSIAKYLSDLDPDDLETSLNLHRRSTNKDKKDELDLVMEAINEHRVRMKEALAARSDAERKAELMRGYMKNIIDSMPSQLIAVDSQGIISLWNREAEHSREVAFQDAVGKSIARLGIFSEATLKGVQETLLTQSPCRIETMEREIAHERRYLDTMIYPLLNEKGETGAVIRVDDVTDRVQVDAFKKEMQERQIREAEQAKHQAEIEKTLETLKAAMDQLVESEKMASLGQLVAGIAHEVNTPLGLAVTGISFINEELRRVQEAFLEARLTKAEFQDNLDRSRDMGNRVLFNLNRAADLIQNFKQIAVDQTRYDTDLFSIRKCIIATLDSLQAEIKKYRLQIEVDCSEKLMIQGYPGALSQIVANLVTNSLFHAFEPGGEGALEFRITTKGDQIVMRYSDTGKGIPREYVKKIFDPFFTTRRGSGGTGLGLYVLFNLVNQKLAGTLTCESVEGKGTTFTVTFPIIIDGAPAQSLHKRTK